MLHYRQIINDNAVTAYQKYVVNWDNFPSSHLSNTQNTTTTEYDALNRIRKAYYPKDRANQRKIMEPTYNKGGALQAVKVGTTDYVSEIAYNARGQRILMAMGNGTMTRYTYDAETFRLSRTKSEKFTKSGHTYTANGGTQQDLAYLYDLEGTILEQNDLAPANTSAQGPGSLKRQFAHDPLRRLISATGRESSNVYQQPSWDLNIRPEDYTATNNYTRTYSYDKLGNIQELDHKATGHSNQDFVRNYVYSGDFNNNQLKQFTYASNTYGYQYDSNGNITKEGTTRNYFWNAGDKLAAYSNQVGTSDPTVYTWYFYNAAGERVKKLVKKGQRLEVTFYMDGGMFETSYVKPTGGSIDNNRFYNTLHVLDGSSRISTIRVGTDADDSTPAIKYYLEDHLMDSLVVLKSDGSLINREEFYPFGETSFGGYGKKRYRFNGKEKDEESGLYNYGQRYYAPWLCRFVSVDPIAESFYFLSSFQYCSNDPTSNIDLDGLEGISSPGLYGLEPARRDKTTIPHPVMPVSHGQSSRSRSRAEQAFTGATNVAAGIITAAAGFTLAIATAPTIAGALGGVIMGMAGLTQAAIGISQLIDATVNENPIVPAVGGGAELVGYGVSERTGNPMYRAAGAGLDIASGMGVGTPARSIPILSNASRMGAELNSYRGFKSGINIAEEGILAYSDYATIQSNLSIIPDFSSLEKQNTNNYSEVSFEEIYYEERVEHEISKGETLSEIANQYGTTVDSLMQMNNIDDSNKIYAGESITVKEIVIHSTTLHSERNGETKNDTGK